MIDIKIDIESKHINLVFSYTNDKHNITIKYPNYALNNRIHIIFEIKNWIEVNSPGGIYRLELIPKYANNYSISVTNIDTGITKNGIIKVNDRTYFALGHPGQKLYEDYIFTIQTT